MWQRLRKLGQAWTRAFSQPEEDTANYLRLETRCLLSVSANFAGGLLHIDILPGGETTAQLLVDPANHSLFFVDANHNSQFDSQETSGPISELQSIKVTGHGDQFGLGDFTWRGNFANAPLQGFASGNAVVIRDTQDVNIDVTATVGGNTFIRTDRDLILGGDLDFLGQANFRAGDRVVDSDDANLRFLSDATIRAGNLIRLADDPDGDANAGGKDRLEVKGELELQLAGRGRIEIGVAPLTGAPSLSVVQIANLSVHAVETDSMSRANDARIAVDSPLIVDSTSVLGQLNLFGSSGDIHLNGIRTDQLIVQTNGGIYVENDAVARNEMVLIGERFIEQNSGILQTPKLLIESNGNISLPLRNEVGSASAPGEFAAIIGRELYFNNAFSIQVEKVSVFDISGTLYSASGITGHGATVHLNANEILLHQPVRAGELLLQSSAGVEQADTGVITADDLILEGRGLFQLDAANRIGTTELAGRIAANIDGNLRIRNEYDLQASLLSINGQSQAGLQLSNSGRLDGDLQIVLSNSDFTQSPGSFVDVHRFTADLGDGNLLLNQFDAVSQETNRIDVLNIKDAKNASLNITGEIHLQTVDLDASGGSLFIRSQAGGITQISGRIIAHQAGLISDGPDGFVHLTNTQFDSLGVSASSHQIDLDLPVDAQVIAKIEQIDGTNTLVSERIAARDFGVFINNQSELTVTTIVDPFGLGTVKGVTTADGSVYLSTMGGDLHVHSNIQVFNPSTDITLVSGKQVFLDGGELLRGAGDRDSAAGVVNQLPAFVHVLDPIPPVAIKHYVIYLFERIQRVEIEFGNNIERDFNARITWADGSMDVYTNQLLQTMNVSEGTGRLVLEKSVPFTLDFLVNNRTLPARLELFNDSQINVFEFADSNPPQLTDVSARNFLGVVSVDKAPAVALPKEAATAIVQPPSPVTIPPSSALAPIITTESTDVPVFANISQTKLVLVRIEDGEVAERLEARSNADSASLNQLEATIKAQGKFLPGRYEIRRETEGGVSEVLRGFEKRVQPE